MQVTFNPSISNNRSNCRKQSPAFGQATQVLSMPIPKGNRGVGVITKFCDHYFPNVTVVDKASLQEAYLKCEPVSFRKILKPILERHNVEIPNI